VELRGVNPSTLAGERSGDDEVLRTAHRHSARSSGTLVRVEIVIALVCSAVTLLGVVYLGAQFFASSTPPSRPQAKGIVWAGRTFVDLAEFGRWLRSQGVTYEVWALRHPTRAGIAPLQPPAAPQEQRGQPSGAGDRSTWTTIAGVAVVLAALLLLLGIRRRKWLPRMRRVLTREQLGVAAQGIAAGGRAVLRLAIVGVRATSKLARSAALVLVGAAQAVAPAIAAGTRLMLRLATVAGRASSTQARAAGRAAWRRRETFGWSAAVVLLATISALAVTFWA
jgi:LPXTG-motif cell wall-anchored protein